MYYVATATAIIEQGPWHEQPQDKVEHGTRLQDVLYNLANEMEGLTHTADSVPIAKWHIEVEVEGLVQQSSLVQ